MKSMRGEISVALNTLSVYPRLAGHHDLWVQGYQVTP